MKTNYGHHGHIHFLSEVGTITKALLVIVHVETKQDRAYDVSGQLLLTSAHSLKNVIAFSKENNFFIA